MVRITDVGRLKNSLTTPNHKMQSATPMMVVPSVLRPASEWGERRHFEF